MLMSQIFAPTLREVPAEAEIPSHKLMLRAGLMRKAAAGIYTYLPLAKRVLDKIETIIREEMDARGGQELLLPVVQPAEIWHETGRWDDYGEEMFRLHDRHNREFCLGPTHEEIITTLVRSEVRSYKQMPLLLYQIQNKYRDEIRPRFGVIRGREFIMKDLYSFDVDEEGMDRSYQEMYDAYLAVFKRCGLDVRPIEADAGAIGGGETHEFVALSESGEATVIYCDSCDYAANVERARCAHSGEVREETGDTLPTLEEFPTVGIRTIAELESAFGITADRMIKTMVYMAGGEPVVVLVRGDHDVNEIKLARALDVRDLELAGEDKIREVTGAPVGFAGPVGLNRDVEIVADYAVMEIRAGVTGANRKDAHLRGVVPGRDFQASRVEDIRLMRAGDVCPQCGSAVKSAKGIEVGQVFKLGTKYSEALGAVFLDESGQENPIMMGCYGIGVSRTMAAIIEQHHDENGICWPVSVAPYHVVILPISYENDEHKAVSHRLQQELEAMNIEAVVDDRDERAGVKFNDADLIGFPIRVTVGPRSLKNGEVEIRLRSTGEEKTAAINQASVCIQSLLASI